MGVDITFTMEHKLADVSMRAVAEECRQLDGLFLEVAQFFRQWYPHLGPPLELWRDAGAFDQGQPFYQAPAGFSFSFGSAAVRIHHLCRFWHFTREDKTRTLLRRFAQGTCKVLGADRVLYAPDEGVGDKIHDWVTDGRSLGDIEAELLRLAPPAATFGEMDARQNPPWHQPAYYVDRFKDIHATVA